MKAVLLAAGLGTRLRPLTDELPKCLVAVAGRAMLDHWLDALAAAGVDDVLVNVHHLAEQVERHVHERGPSGPRVRLVREPSLLGSAGTLRANADFLDDGTFLVINSDNLTDFDLGHLLDAHARSDRIATLTAFRTPRPTECGILESRDGVMVAFEEKPATPINDLANAGMYAFEPGIIDLVRGPAPLDIGAHLVPRLVGRAGVLDIGNSFFADIGTPEALERASTAWIGAAP
jgi:mannose-1-phosphate guanylyltransferase